ncbi:MAG: LytTR family transcriptional regulator DNA-binding domain-containing protein [Candidatus Korobacteraceae bacterium]
MATSMLVQPSPATLGGIRVVLCDPDGDTRTQLRSFLDQDPLLRLVGETVSWAQCELVLEELAPELLIVRAELLPADWTHRNVPNAFLPVVIELQAFMGPMVRAPLHSILPTPLTPDAVRKCLNHALTRIYDKKAKELLYLVDRYIAASGPVSSYRSRIVVEQGGQLIELRADTILSIVAARKCVTIHTLSGHFLLREPLHSFLAKLDPHVFLRIHRSIIINRIHLEKTISITAKTLSVVLVNGSRYPIGPNYRHVLAELADDAISNAVQ